MLEPFPSCFRDNGQHARDDSTSNLHSVKVVQSSVICLYQTKLAGFCKPVSVTWCKGLLGQGFSVSIDEPAHIRRHVCKIDMRLWRFWKKQGSKTVDVEGKRLEVFWDFSDAKYTCGPEPREGFYVALLCNGEIVLLLGDMQREAYKKTAKLALDSSNLMQVQVGATLLSKKEHLFGKKIYNTRAQFEESGLMHDITVECHVGDHVKEPWLCVRIDKQAVVRINHLMWKFRGNQMIHVDGLPIEVLWDVHNWLFNPSSACAVFMFHTYAAGATEEKPCDWPLLAGEMAGAHYYSASIMEWPASHSFKDHKDIKQYWCKDSTSFASILEWPNSYSFKGVSKESRAMPPPAGFSLLLYAWRSDQ